VRAPAVVETREDRIRLGPFVEHPVLGPILPEGVLLLALVRGERGVSFSHEGAVVLALLARVGAPLLVRLALEPGLLFGLFGGLALELGLLFGGLAHRRGERSPPVQLCDRLDGVGKRPVLLGESPELGELALQRRAQRRKLLALRGERPRRAQLVLAQPVQLALLGVVEGLSEW
jgi:hypothetical protein